MLNKEGGCIESSKMECGSWRDCCQSGVNLATSVYRNKPGSKLELKSLVVINKFANLCVLSDTVYSAIMKTDWIV